MNEQEYNEAALVFESTKNLPAPMRLIHVSLGLTSEQFELEGSLATGTRTHIIEELGDALWYVVVAIDVLKDFHREVGPDTRYGPDILKRWAFYDIMPNAAEFNALYYDFVDSWIDFIKRNAKEWDVTMDEIRYANIRKLSTRYPEKKWSKIRAEVRDIPAEIKALEGQ